MRTLSIVIPVFNEENYVAKLLEQVVAVQLIQDVKKQIIVLDNGSQDNSETIIRDFISSNPAVQIEFHKYSEKIGKGATIRYGFTKCTGDYILVQDADLEYNPQDYNLLLQPVLANQADVVFGSRMLNPISKKSMFYTQRMANLFLTFVYNGISGAGLTDMETCYKLFPAEWLKKQDLHEVKFGFEPEVASLVQHDKTLRLTEVPISFKGRRKSEGKKIKWTDAIRATYCIFRYNSWMK